MRILKALGLSRRKQPSEISNVVDAIEVSVCKLICDQNDTTKVYKSSSRFNKSGVQTITYKLTY